MNTILKFLSQQSTVKGILQAVGGAAGFTLSQNIETQIVSAVVALVGVLNAIRNERKEVQKHVAS